MQDNQMYGNWGRILSVDLSHRRSTTQLVKEDFFKKYLGGVGLASKIIFDKVGADVHPFSPDNVIVFSVGPFQGTGIPGSGRWNVSSRSPLTGIWGESCGGGYWGPEFKRSGFDAVVIKGRAKSPVYIWIDDGRAEIRDGDSVWGKMVSEADKVIKEEIGEPSAKAVIIGPAGEKLVRFACVVSDHGVGGRCGLGAVMGSKNLKAIAVRGTKEVKVAEPDKLKEYSGELYKKIHEATGELRKYGTAMYPKLIYEARGYGLAKNWREGVFDGIDELTGDRFLEITVNPIACANCPIACHRRIKVVKPEKYAFEGYGPEYETIGMIGWLNLISDPEAIAYAGHLCNEYGLDTITAGSMIGFTMECYEKRWIKEKELEGIKAEWGSPDVAIALIHKMARREGFGNILAEGSERAAKIIGGDASKILVNVKKLELPAHDPRGFLAMAINYATGQRGACHQRGFVLQDESSIPEWGILENQEVYSIKEPVISAIRYQDWAEIFNSLIQCEYMTSGGLTLKDQIALLNYVTGWKMGADDMLKIGERIFNLQRVINIRFGVSRKDDALPSRIFEPLKEGVNAGKTPATFEKALREYYKLRGWDADGKPTAEKLTELNLTETLIFQAEKKSGKTDLTKNGL